jgi:hypothetical protein
VIDWRGFSVPLDVNRATSSPRVTVASIELSAPARAQ